jgi:hypothetical protein
MVRAGGGRGAHGVDAELLRELTPDGRVVTVDVGLRSGSWPDGMTVGSSREWGDLNSGCGVLPRTRCSAAEPAGEVGHGEPVLRDEGEGSAVGQGFASDECRVR